MPQPSQPRDGRGPTVRTVRKGAVTTVVLSRPAARNAVDGPTARALADAFRAFDADDEAAVAVLWGEGGTFCAGADLKAIGTDRGNRVTDIAAADTLGSVHSGASAYGEGSVHSEDLAHGHAAAHGGNVADGDGPMGPTRMRLGKPVIAAVSGHAVAGGLELALWCDLRVAEESAIFGVFCRRWGVPLIDGGTVRLPRLIGAGRAMDLVLTGRPVDAAEALAIGLADRVVPTGTARAAAEQLAAQIAAFPQTCLRHDRLALLEGQGLPEDAALAVELAHGRISLAEAARGAARFAAGEGRHGAYGG
ncbi:crotonase/enoyl-CoA hydratase family protein [Actinacidiphila paucisporea]|uniref:Enoyl-CoA hydratase n=1 Tax=Actinacidiphila paucisporea TaxID=310782 RepID=A0A1M7JTX9_9ACTN|nr:crotonase/enoyl-CoA hydratase family protein [Actinacidiphila paucisporea]SHM56448.1 enoyl-CoA hydratase [Actinacidiphila paucisporea]